MAKKNKLSTPDWIKEGYDSKEDYEKAKGIKKKEKGRIFRIKECPKCGSRDVRVILGGEEGKGPKGWECKKCKWKGQNIVEKELNEEEFLEYLDEKSEGVA